MKVNPVLFLIVLFTLLFSYSPCIAQRIDAKTIQSYIQQYKKVPRGPYKDIRWFCVDGSFKVPKDSCDLPGSVQRARYKDEVIKLAQKNHIFLGQILSTTDNKQFWDAQNNHSQLKQYQLAKYLGRINDGWILSRAQYYRGAFQAEDEEAWGRNLFYEILANDQNIEQHFFLIREAAKDIPHGVDDFTNQNIRALSKVISDTFPSFIDLRVKIHGRPQKSDLRDVIHFRNANKKKLDEHLLENFEKLIGAMRERYKEISLSDLHYYFTGIPNENPVRASLEAFVEKFSDRHDHPEMLSATVNNMYEIRQQFLTAKSPQTRLALLDISLILENIYSGQMSSWEVKTLKELCDKIYFTGQAAAATGFLEFWEWKAIAEDLYVPTAAKISLGRLMHFQENARRVLDWSINTLRANYQDVMLLYSPFEPLASGFIDDKIRSSLLLNFGESVGHLSALVAQHAGYQNQVMNISNQHLIKGLYPGIAMGELVVVTGNVKELKMERDKIYLFTKPPSDLEPIAGIATVSEGNLVSHVQLLARNLGIPNAVISMQNLKELLPFHGQRVFYAVSNKGRVILKPASMMNAEERKFFEKKERSRKRVRIPIKKINLSLNTIVNLREVSALSSGVICGPKAANLAQLKRLFPEHVVEGLVIPFGVFRMHMDQQIPGKEWSYWKYLHNIFDKAQDKSRQGVSEIEIEKFVLDELALFRSYVKEITLSPGIKDELKMKFKEILGDEMGKIPVFVRSDTNMEDLKEFTGAGLNLTVFNVVDEGKIWQGIKDVWASPYTERSYMWRQQFLLNPENVFPSILIIPTVDVDYSGVLITKGIGMGDNQDLTVAINRGAGGAVDGQGAESYILFKNGRTKLISPARESSRRVLPVTGGSKKAWISFENPILSRQNLQALRSISDKIKNRLDRTIGFEKRAPYDIEFGFLDDHIWLFQIRPFNENELIATNNYLEEMTPEFSAAKEISLLENLANIKASGNHEE